MCRKIKSCTKVLSPSNIVQHSVGVSWSYTLQYDHLSMFCFLKSLFYQYTFKYVSLFQGDCILFSQWFLHRGKFLCDCRFWTTNTAVAYWEDNQVSGKFLLSTQAAPPSQHINYCSISHLNYILRRWALVATFMTKAVSVTPVSRYWDHFIWIPW